MKPAPKYDRAAFWLRTVLRDNQVPAKDIERMAKENGISDKALKMAKKSLRIRSEKKGRTLKTPLFSRIFLHRIK